MARPERVKPERKRRPREARGSIVTSDMVANLIPSVAAVTDVLHETVGPLGVNVADKATAVLLVLEAHVTELTVTGGTEGQWLVLLVEQGGWGGFSWDTSNLRLSGGGPAPVSPAGSRDVYTLLFDGETWNETSRALNLTDPGVQP